MTIRFGCDCGARFEVPDDQAGLTGRCLGCGKELSIPDPPGDLGDLPAVAPPKEPARLDDLPSVGGLFCPFCGAVVRDGATQCPRCSRVVDLPERRPDSQLPLTTADRIFSTLFGPAGILAGFINLLRGQRKGLDMMAIATASTLVWWLLMIVFGLIR